MRTVPFVSIMFWLTWLYRLLRLLLSPKSWWNVLIGPFFLLPSESSRFRGKSLGRKQKGLHHLFYIFKCCHNSANPLTPIKALEASILNSVAALSRCLFSWVPLANVFLGDPYHSAVTLLRPRINVILPAQVGTLETQIYWYRNIDGHTHVQISYRQILKIVQDFPP